MMAGGYDKRDSVCDECARRMGYEPEVKAVGVWMGECDFCGRRKPLTSLSNDWKKRRMKVMKRIGFSQYYPKLHGQTKAVLLAVDRVDRRDISGAAVEYDTVYWRKGVKERFPLPDGRYIRLVFLGNFGIPFTTYRKDKVENQRKYFGAVGTTFEVYVKEDAV